MAYRCGGRPVATLNCRAKWGQDVSDQVHGQDVGQGLGGERAARAAGGQLGIHRPHCAPEVRKLYAVERRTVSRAGSRSNASAAPA